MDLYLTGTLYAGRRTRFADDMGAGIDEIDHDAAFHFSNDGACRAGDLRFRETMGKLAVASRCTSSFPGAFEPHFVAVDGRIVDDRDARWWDTRPGRPPSTAARPDRRRHPAEESRSARPWRRSTEAGPAGGPPGAGLRGPAAGAAQRPGERHRPPVPRADEVVLSVLTRLRATDSVARELTEIRRSNEAVRQPAGHPGAAGRRDDRQATNCRAIRRCGPATRRSGVASRPG